jgi:selenocysteine lyase/cysteine desulfurase
MKELMIDCQRNLFDIPDDVAYFNVAGVSPLLKSVQKAGEQGLTLKTNPWKIGPEQFFKNVNEIRETFAKLVGCSGQDIAITPSATYGVETAIKNISLKTGDEIVIQAEEFPALVLPLQRLAKTAGAKIVTVPRPRSYEWTESYLENINPRTKIAAFCPSHWTDGTRIDSARVLQKTKANGIITIVDVCQSLGACPLNIKELSPDFLVAPTYKWLLGPYSFGFLYVDPKFQNGSPLEEYWASRKNAEDFTRLTSYEPDYEKGAARFDMSERSQFINLPMAKVALEQILSWTPQAISDYLEPICDTIAGIAANLGFEVAPKIARSPHFIGIRHPKGFSESFKNYLVSEKIFVGFRGDWMRISPHVYNNQKDIEKLCTALKVIS